MTVIKVEGVSKLLNGLKNLDVQTANKLDKVIDNGGNNIWKDARKLAPVDTGTLRRLIVHKHIPLVSVVTSKAKYSQHVNFGTRRMKAQPYFTNAINLNKRTILNNIKKILKF